MRYIRTGNDVERECSLLLSKVYHRLCLVGNTIYITQFMPRQPDSNKEFPYRYLFQVPDSDHYTVSSTRLVSKICIFLGYICTFFRFKMDHMDKLNWSQLDTALQSRDPVLFDYSMKSYMSRYYLHSTK